MAGHSHWAGIKHKKGRQDKERSRIFSKLSREITVAAKLGAKDPDSNPRLRSAIQAAKESNMPKDNISRAINKSELNSTSNYSNLRYEGYGPFNVALIIETLSDNKNRTASKIRQILQKGGGNLGESGSTSYLFYNCGVIGVEKTYFSEEEINDEAFYTMTSDISKALGVKGRKLFVPIRLALIVNSAEPRLEMVDFSFSVSFEKSFFRFTRARTSLTVLEKRTSATLR